MRNFFDDLGKAFLYKRNVGLSHYNGELVVNSSELMDIKKATRQITDFIYKTYYSKQGSLSKGKLFDEITIETDDSFLMKLSTIYSEKMQESNNWIVIEKISEHNFKVFKQDITLTIDKNIHLPINERTINLRKGDVITILFSCHFPNISHGFYVFKSDMGEIDISLGIGRLYFNLNFEYAVDFSKGLLSLLYSNKLKFDYKIFKNLRTQYRVDSAVLYFSLNDYNQILKLIMPFIFSNPQMFNDEVSVFHNTVAKGVGFAEEPIEKHEHESYGLNRCRIIAETIYDSLNVIESTGIIPFENFEKKFMQKNINLDKMFLNPNSILDGLITQIK